MLLFKLPTALPISYFFIFNAYLADRYIVMNHNIELTLTYIIKSRIPEFHIAEYWSFCYTIYSRLPCQPVTDSLAPTFAGDTAILASHTDNNLTSPIPQNHPHKIEQWLGIWSVRANKIKLVQVAFTNRRGACPPVTLNNQQLPQRNETKYLGMHLDLALWHGKNVFTKRTKMAFNLRHLHWMICHQSALSIKNKLFVCKLILKPSWTYGI